MKIKLEGSDMPLGIKTSRTEYENTNYQSVKTRFISKVIDNFNNLEIEKCCGDPWYESANMNDVELVIKNSISSSIVNAMLNFLNTGETNILGMDMDIHIKIKGAK